jgi:hypothetical protein
LSVAAENTVLRSVLQTLPFIVGIFGISLIVICLAWSVFGFATADAPIVTKIVGP